MTLDLTDYFEIHLGYELKYLLVAATTWTAVHEPTRRGPHAPHLVELAMESAFVHARVLYEFLQLEEGWSDRSPHVAERSELWAAYRRPMHEKVLHPSPRRPFEPGARPGDDLKDRVKDFAIDIIAMWSRVAMQLAMSDYRSTMERVLARAVEDGRLTARWFRIEPIA